MIHVRAVAARSTRTVADEINNLKVIKMRDENGLLVYDREYYRSLCTEKENAIDDEYMKKFLELFDKRDRGEISQEECTRLYEELDAEHTAACEQLYDEEFGKQSKNAYDENFFASPNVATA